MFFVLVGCQSDEKSALIPARLALRVRRAFHPPSGTPAGNGRVFKQSVIVTPKPVVGLIVSNKRNEYSNSVFLQKSNKGSIT